MKKILCFIDNYRKQTTKIIKENPSFPIVIFFSVLIKKADELHFKFKKFFASKVLGKKYIRTGKCKACGRCCQEIYVRHTAHIIKDEQEFEKLKTQHFFYSYLKVIGKNETGLIFECTKLNKEKGVCTAYRQRALICRQYPLEEVFMMGGSISDDCGFRFIPIKSFEDVFKTVQKKPIKEFELESG